MPAIWSAAYGQNVSGTKLLEAAIAGYETVTSVARTSHPDLRRRGFHPTGVVGSLGAAMASGRLLGLSRPQLSHALGLAASASAGLFAFLGGGWRAKRRADNSAWSQYGTMLDWPCEDYCAQHT